MPGVPPSPAAISQSRKQQATRARCWFTTPTPRTRLFVLLAVGLLSLSARFAADINWRRAVNDDSLFISNVIHLLQPKETTDDTKDSKRRKHQPSSFLGDEYRLELLHIPKTGGTMLEVLAMEHNITWGACHFEFPWRTKPKCILRHCPRPLMRLSPSSSSSSSSSPSATTTASSAGVMLNNVDARNSSTTL